MDQKTSLFKYQITTVIQSIFSNDNDILLGINSMENYEKIHVLKFLKRLFVLWLLYFFSFSFPFFFFFPKKNSTCLWVLLMLIKKNDVPLAYPQVNLESQSYFTLLNFPFLPENCFRNTVSSSFIQDSMFSKPFA